MIPWDFFAKRRGYNLATMLKSGQLTTYDGYSQWCLGKGVAPVSEEVFNQHKPKPEPKPKPKPKVTVPTDQKSTITTKKTSTRKVKGATKAKGRVSASRNSRSDDGKD